MELLKCENASFSYEGKTVLSDVSFSVKSGEFLSIVGENGSGKSTLIKGLLGFIKPDSGEIVYENGLKKSKIGYLPQQTALKKDFPASVYEVVLSGTLNNQTSFPFYTKTQKETAMCNMERLKITDIKNKSFKELSGGQRQRVLLARALCSAHLMLLLDEPAAGLDIASQEDLYNIIKELNEKDKMSIVMISHDIPAAISLSDYILHLKNEPVYFGKSENYKMRGEK